MRIDQTIKALRMECGLSQSELSEKLNIARATVVRWESGESYPKKKMADKIRALLKTLDVSEHCKQNVLDALSDGRRQGTSAREYGIDEIDLELVCKIVDESANAVYAIEADTHRLLYANQQTEWIAPYDSKKSKNQKCYEYMMGQRTPCPDCPLTRIVGYEFVEQILPHRDGKSYLRIRGRKMKWNGRDVYIIYVTNVTDLVKAENAKQQFLDLMPTGAGIYRVYTDGRIELVYMNDGFYRMFHMKREDSLLQPGFTFLDLVHPDDRAILREKIEYILRNPETILNEVHRINLGDDIYRKIILRGLITEKNKYYVTANCSFVVIE